MSANGSPRNPEVRFEPTDVDARALLRFGLMLVLGTVAVVLLLWRLFHLFLVAEAARQPPPPVMKADPRALLPPPPRLQTQPARDLTTHRADEDRILGTYAWVDREKGIARIPIDEAMQTVAEQGLPEWQPAASGSPLPATPAVPAPGATP